MFLGLEIEKLDKKIGSGALINDSVLLPSQILDCGSIAR